MDGATSSQQDNWQNNIYFLTTTRILMVLGLTFLIRSVYQLYQRMRWTGSGENARDVEAGANTEIDIEAFPLERLGSAATPTSGAVDGINETLAITFPLPTHSPGARSLPRTLS